MLCAEACVGHARENVEATVAAQELGECRGEVGEVANISILALRTGIHCLPHRCSWGGTSRQVAAFSFCS